MSYRYMGTQNYEPALTLEELLKRELYESFENFDRYELINSENREFKYELDSEIDIPPSQPNLYPVVSDTDGNPYVFINATTDELFIKDSDGKLLPYGERDKNIVLVEDVETDNTLDLTAIEDVKRNLIKADKYPKKVVYEETKYEIKEPPTPPPTPPELPKTQLVNIDFLSISNKIKSFLVKYGFNKETQNLVILQLDNNIDRGIVLLNKIKILDGIKFIDNKLDNKLEIIEDEDDEDIIRLFKLSIPKKIFKIVLVVLFIIIVILILKRFVFRYHRQAIRYIKTDKYI